MHEIFMFTDWYVFLINYFLLLLHNVTLFKEEYSIQKYIINSAFKQGNWLYINTSNYYFKCATIINYDWNQESSDINIIPIDELKTSFRRRRW